MNREYWLNDTGRGNSKNLSHCHFAQQKFRMGWPGIQTELLRWEAVDHFCAVERPVRNFYISFPVGNFYISFPVGNIYISFPAGNFYLSFPVGNIYISFPAGNFYIRFSAGNFCIYLMYRDNFCISFPAGNFYISFPVGNIYIIFPAGNFYISFPAGNFYISFPVGNMKPLTLCPSRLTFLFSGWSCHASRNWLQYSQTQEVSGNRGSVLETWGFASPELRP